MPLTNVYLHKHDGPTFQRIPQNAFINIHSQWQYQLRAGVSSNPARGITWDGASIWICTDGDSGSGDAPALIQLDPNRSGFGLVPKKIITAALSSQDDLKDIAWNGRGFYGIIEKGGFTPAYWLILLDKNGALVKTLNTGLASTERAITFDGAKIWTTYTAGTPALAYARSYDPISGTRLSTSLFDIAYSTTPTEGPGFVFDGGGFQTKVTSTTGEYYKHEHDLSAGTLSPSKAITYTSYPSAAAEQSALAWDGAFAWTLAQVT